MTPICASFPLALHFSFPERARRSRRTISPGQPSSITANAGISAISLLFDRGRGKAVQPSAGDGSVVFTVFTGVPSLAMSLAVSRFARRSAQTVTLCLAVL
jgi:hypothetical protein